MTDIKLDHVRPFVRFHLQRYQRNLAHQGPTYHALILCWKSGQRSPIHDHAGSTCVVKVLHGIATETLFDHAPNGMIYPVSSQERTQGQSFASQDENIHQVSNLQAADNLITLHIYSPPLLVMNQYSLLDGAVSQFFDPVNDEFVSGAGI